MEEREYQRKLAMAIISWVRRTELLGLDT
jgi:hypothetical protein